MKKRNVFFSRSEPFALGIIPLVEDEKVFVLTNLKRFPAKAAPRRSAKSANRTYKSMENLQAVSTAVSSPLSLTASATGVMKVTGSTDHRNLATSASRSVHSIRYKN